MLNNPQAEQLLITKMLEPEIADDPYNFVMFTYPWGQKGTPLEKFKGPRAWQKAELIAIKDHIQENKRRASQKLAPLVYKSATSSGRGTGKSA